MALFLEQTLLANLGWVVFEPNDGAALECDPQHHEAFMLGFSGKALSRALSPSEAFQVKCDHQTTTQEDINNGIVNIVVAFAPLKPAEFVIIKIARSRGRRRPNERTLLE